MGTRDQGEHRENVASFRYVGPWEEPKLVKLAHIEPDTLPDAGDYNALVDVVNALADVVDSLVDALRPRIQTTGAMEMEMYRDEQRSSSS